MIYLLEDDDSIRKLVVYTLKSQQMESEGFEKPSDFWKAMQVHLPELILLDIMLPEEDGLGVLKKLRSNPKTKGIPVVMLTAKATEYDTVTGLDTGADDYITKPFGMMALVARIKAVKRRYEAGKTASPGTELTAGNIVVSKEKHCVWVDGKQVFLTLKEFDMLVLLLENKGNVLTREQLLNSVWNYENDIESRTIDVHVRTLRQKLGASGELLETIRGVGYKIGE